MPVKRVTPDEAARLLEQGWTYVDVRSIEEFAQGHPQGAYNVPYLHAAAGGMTPNPDFAAVMEASFSKDDRLVLGCRSGKRSLRAAEELAARGFASLVDMRGGFSGEVDASGQLAVAGWSACGLPVSTEAGDRAYDQLQKCG